MPLQLKKTLLIRMDRIGDLVLTLPIEEGIRKVQPQADIGWWIPKGLRFVTDNAETARTVREVPVKFSLKVFRALRQELEINPPKLAIVFHAPWWVSLLLYLAKVPVRAGPKSQWHQHLFLNKKLKQKRSAAVHHELEYNFQLAEFALGLGPGWLPRTHLALKSSNDSVLAKHALQKKSYIVIHPGMGGSALNWPFPLYAQLISRLSGEQKVVITGTPSDEPFISPVRNSLVGNEDVLWLDGKLNGDELISILKNARAVVAPSTGVLHLAASCGTPTIGLFSPVAVQKPTRWGPQGPVTRVLQPAVDCPGHFSCIGEKCRHFACMQQISVASIQLAIKELTN